jgi:hypothetical protein
LYLSERIKQVWQPNIYNDDGNLMMYFLSVATKWLFPQAYHDYSHRFTQVRDPGIARTAIIIWDYSPINNGWAGGFYCCTPLTIVPDRLITRHAHSQIMGFSLKDSVKEAFRQYYSQDPLVIPAERIWIQSYSTGPTSAGLNCSMNANMINATEQLTTFAWSPNAVTCFINPEYDHLMITTLNRNFPQKGCNTNSTDFYRMEEESCNLDSILYPTKSFQASYKNKRCPNCPFRMRCKEDDTDFLLIFNIQRQSAGHNCPDVVNSMGETISLTGSPQVQGFGGTGSGTETNGGDTYYYLNADNDVPEDLNHAKVNHTAPIQGIVSLTQWFFSVGELAIYEIALTGNEALARHFPNALQRLAGAQ